MTDKLIIPGSTPLPAWTREDGTMILVWGDEGVGKTDWAFSASKILPVVLFDLELNTKGPMRRYAEMGIEIPHFEYRVPPFDQRGEALATFNRFKNDFYENTLATLKKNNQRAVLVIDSGTKLWQLACYAIVPLDDKGRTTSPWNYGPVNNFWRALGQTAKWHGHILIIISRTEDVWVKDDETKKMGATGEKRADIQKDTSWDADVVIRITNTPEMVANDKGGKDLVMGRYIEVKKCNLNGKVQGMRRKASFPQLIDLIEVME